MNIRQEKWKFLHCPAPEITLSVFLTSNINDIKSSDHGPNINSDENKTAKGTQCSGRPVQTKYIFDAEKCDSEYLTSRK